MLNLTYKKILDIIFVFFLVSALITEHSVIGKSALLLFVGAALLPAVKGKLYANWFFVMEAIFIVYCILQILYGIPMYKDVSVDRVQTMILCLLFDIALYNYMVYQKNPWRVVEILVKSFAVTISIIVLLNLRWLLAGGRGNSAGAIKVLGIAIGDMNAVNIGWVAGIGLLLSVILYTARKEYAKCLRYATLFTVLILISGTRKMLAVLPVAFLIYKMMVSKDKNEILQLLKNIFIVVGLGIILLLLLLKVPVLYNIIGKRVESVLEYVLTGSGGDSSMTTRMRLAGLARDAIRQKPVFGWGLDNFKYVFYNGKYYTHNNFLEIGVSGGIIGFILYYIKYVYVYIRLFSARKTREIFVRKYIFAFVLMISVFVVMEYWQVTYFNRLSIMLLTLCLGFLDSSKSEKNCSNTVYLN